MQRSLHCRLQSSLKPCFHASTKLHNAVCQARCVQQSSDTGSEIMGKRGGLGGGCTWLQVRVSSSRQYRSFTLPAPVLPPNSHRRRPSSLLLRLAPMRPLGGSTLHRTHTHRLHAWGHRLSGSSTSLCQHDWVSVDTGLNQAHGCA